jgi:hypothetical protein
MKFTISLAISIIFVSCGGKGLINVSDNDSINNLATVSSGISACSTANAIQQLDTSNNSIITENSGVDYAYAITTDSVGNIFIAGQTSSDLFETNAGGYDIFIAKFDHECNLLWGTQVGTDTVPVASGALLDEVIYDENIAVDSLGNVYVAGFTQSNLGDSFWAKFDSSGDLVAIHQFGTTTATGNGFVATGGDYCEAFVFIEDEDNPSNSSVILHVQYRGGGIGSDLMLQSYDTDGNVNYMRLYTANTEASITGGLTGNNDIYAMTVGSDGNIYMAGSTRSDFTETKAGAAGSIYDIIHAKINPVNGDVIFFKQIGDTSAPGMGIDADESDGVGGIITDSDNNYYIAYHTKGDFLETNAGTGTQDMGVLKFDSDGNFIWGNQIGTTSGGSDQNEIPLAIRIYGDDLFITARTKGSAFDTNDGVGTTWDNLMVKVDKNTGAFTAKKQLTGAYASSLGITTTEMNDIFAAIHIDESGNVYLSGCSASENFLLTNADNDCDYVLMKLTTDFLLS